jgi:hypothetical protein
LECGSEWNLKGQNKQEHDVETFTEFRIISAVEQRKTSECIPEKKRKCQCTNKAKQSTQQCKGNRENKDHSSGNWHAVKAKDSYDM